MSLETVDVGNAKHWRSWLQKNHLKNKGVWLVFHRKGSTQPTLSYDEAIDEALAYGWIDSIIKKIDEERFVRKFSPRHLGSVWSKYNLERVEKLTAEGRMTK